MSTRLALSSRLRAAPSRFLAHLASHPWAWSLSGGYALALSAMLSAVPEVRGSLATAALALAGVFLSLGLGLTLTLGAIQGSCNRHRAERRARCMAILLVLLGLPAAIFGITPPFAMPQATPARIAAAFPVATACTSGSVSRNTSLANIPPALAQSTCRRLSQRAVQVGAALRTAEHRRPLHKHIQVLVSPRLSFNAETWELPGHSFLIEVDYSTVLWLPAPGLVAIVGHEMGHAAASRAVDRQARTGGWALAVLAAAGWLSLLACFVHTRHARPRKAVPWLAGTCLALGLAALGLCASVALLQRRAEYAADRWGASITSPHRMAMALALLSAADGDGNGATALFSDHPSLAARARALGVDVANIRSEASHYFPQDLASHRPQPDSTPRSRSH